MTSMTQLTQTSFKTTIYTIMNRNSQPVVKLLWHRGLISKNSAQYYLDRPVIFTAISTTFYGLVFV